MIISLSGGDRGKPAISKDAARRAIAIAVDDGTYKLQGENKKLKDSYAQILGERASAVELADKWRIRFWVALGVLGGYDVLFTVYRLASGHAH